MSVSAWHLCSSSIVTASAGLQVGTISALPLQIVIETDDSSPIGGRKYYSDLDSDSTTDTDFEQQQALSQNWVPSRLPMLPYFTSVGLQSTSESDPVSFCVDEVELLPSLVHGELLPCCEYSAC